MKAFRLLFVVLLCLPAAASNPRARFPLQLKVLTAASHRVEGPPLVPTDCGIRDYDGYCHGSAPVPYVENTMLVREADGTVLHVGCWVYNRWSHCADLPVNQTFEAKKEKHGLAIQYFDEHHKLRTQLYEVEDMSKSSR